ncbi:IS3 family transposase [Neptuniibacter marinus]|uniref:IS3 family transposase n=1 Tax=Neptuniibacter marinus TaxID=1806670 RepID=UPI003B5AD758
MVQELKATFKLTLLLKACELSRSVFYYQCQALQKPDNYAREKVVIRQIFDEHKGRYGYRRILLALRAFDIWLNHKTVLRLMTALKLKSIVRPKRYQSYKGDIGKGAPHVLQRNFDAQKPNEKWVTDVTEFNVKGQKIYLSPIIDLFNREVVTYRTAKSARLPLVTDMLEEAVEGLKECECPIFHSDQGWQYRNPLTQKILSERGLTQSMSRKGNCLDNAAAESFFAVLKTEMYHQQEFKNADDLINQIDEYIEYYNTKRIKVKLKGLTPVEYRKQALLTA